MQSNAPLSQLLLTEGPDPDQERWLGKFVEDDAYDHLVKDSRKVVRADGRTLVVLIKDGLSKKAGLAMYQAVRNRIAKTENRGLASGGVRVNNLKKDGTRSRTNRSTVSVASGVMGFFDRYPRFPYCRKTAFNDHHPEAYDACVPALQESTALFKAHAPEQYAAQAAVCAQTSPDFVIPGTVFTTVTLNKNFRTACHRDAGDFPEGFGVMSYFRGGKFTGGRLVFPAYRVAVELNSFDVILFDPHEIHGNTPVVPLGEAPYERITCVHYYRKNMVYCGSAAEELALAKAHDPRQGSRAMTVKPSNRSESGDASAE